MALALVILGDKMDCQLMGLPEAGEALSIREQLSFRYVWKTSLRVLRDPGLVFRKVRQALDRRHAHFTASTQSSAPRAVVRPPLGLKPGDPVFIRSAEEIRETLDENGRYEGLGYLPLLMDQFCGRPATVHKSIHRFFDERKWQLLKLRDVVILEGIYCEPSTDAPQEYAGCERTCFLFWKEAWLRRR